MKPVPYRDRVLARQLTGRGPELFCLDLKTGRRLWRARPGDHVASDPLPLEESIHVLTVSREQDETLLLHHTSLDLHSGRILAQNPLGRWRDAWKGRFPCQAVLAGHRIVATAGGCVLSCDLQGRARWLRRRIWLPPEESWLEKHREPPLVSGEDVFVCQPGVESIDCLDLESGRRRWERPLPGVRRICGLHGKNLIVRTAGGLISLECTTGRVLWRRDLTGPWSIELSGGRGDLLATTMERDRENSSRWTPTLVWIDPRSGIERARSPIRELSHRKPRIGPLVARGEGLWTFSGNDDGGARRDLVELAPAGEALPGLPADLPLGPWTSPVDPDLSRRASGLFPGWTLLSSGQDRKTGFSSQEENQGISLVTLATREQPVVLGNLLSLPAGSRADLTIQLGRENAPPWTLEVRAGARILLEREVDRKDARNQPLEVELDLTELAGKNVWLLVSQKVTGDPVHGRWNRLEVRR